MSKSSLGFCFSILGFLLGATSEVLAQPTPGTILWTYDSCQTITTSPAVAPDGTVYIGTCGSLTAITNSGSVASAKWNFPAWVSCSPTVGADGTIYFGNGDTMCDFYAVNPDGSQKWAYHIALPYQIQYRSTPAIGWDNTVYFVAGSSIYALGPDGSKKWDYPIDEPFRDPVSPVIGLDGTIYVGSIWPRVLYALNPDGTKKWSVGFFGAIMGDSPAIALDGTIYPSTGSLNAVAPNGSVLWSQASPSGAYSGFTGSSAIGNDGGIYVGDQAEGCLFSFKPNGEQVWSAGCYNFGTNPPPTTLAIDSRGNLYYCSSNSVFALTSQGEILWSIPLVGHTGFPNKAITSPAIGPDRTIYATLDNHLYAIAGTNALADAAWPMYRQNARHTGKLEKPSLQQPHKNSDGSFGFSFYGQLGGTYTVLRSADLSIWLPLTNFTVGEVPTAIVDTTVTDAGTRFYRAVSQQ